MDITGVDCEVLRIWISNWNVAAPTLKPNASSMSSPVKLLSARVLRPRSHECPQKTTAVRSQSK